MWLAALCLSLVFTLIIGRIRETALVDEEGILVAFEEGGSRMLQNVPVSEHSFSLEVDFSLFDKAVEAGKKENQEWALSEDLENQISAIKENFSKVKNYIGEFFRVTFKEELKIPAYKCSSKRYSFGPVYVKNIDFYIFVFLENNENSESPIQAINCLVEEESGRPVVGVVLINLLTTSSSQPDSRQLFRRYLHEFFHMLGYNSYIFQNFPNKDEIPTEGSQPISEKSMLTSIADVTYRVGLVTAQSVVTLVKDYFGCSTAEGLPIHIGSDDAVLGNHASFLHQPYSIMNGASEIDSVIDKLTIGYLKSTGWYIVNDSAIEKNISQGFDPSLSPNNDPCDAFNLICPATKDSCSLEQAEEATAKCSSNRLSKQVCEVHPGFGQPVSGLECAFWKNTHDYCREGEPHEEWDAELEQISDSSLCFMASLGSEVSESLKASCLRYWCDPPEENNGTASMTISLANSVTVTCSSEGVQTLSDKSGADIQLTIDCPDPAEYCNADGSQLAADCPLDCTKEGRGMCMEAGECFCFFGSEEDSDKCAEYKEEEEAASSSPYVFQVLTVKQLALLSILVLWSCVC